MHGMTDNFNHNPCTMTQINFDELVQSALQARRLAYAPYSQFAVGAALQASDGSLFSGCNVENASYGLTICAERVAVGSAVAAGRQVFTGLVVATQAGAAPCGACLQVLAEFCDQLPIAICDAGGRIQRTTSLNEMLPDRFRRAT